MNISDRLLKLILVEWEEEKYEGYTLIPYNKVITFPKDWEKDVEKFIAGIEDQTYTINNKERKGIFPKTHAVERILERHNYYPVKKDLNVNEVFELKYDRPTGKLIKVGFRNEVLSQKKSYVFIVDFNGKLVTTWPNDKKDRHATLDKEIYSSEILHKGGIQVRKYGDVIDVLEASDFKKSNEEQKNKDIKERVATMRQITPTLQNVANIITAFKNGKEKFYYIDDKSNRLVAWMVR